MKAKFVPADSNCKKLWRKFFKLERNYNTKKLTSIGKKEEQEIINMWIYKKNNHIIFILKDYVAKTKIYIKCILGL